MGSFSQHVINLPKELEKKYNNPSSRLKNKTKLNNLIQNVFSNKSSKNIIQSFKKFKIAFGILNSIKEFSTHPQLKKAIIKNNGDDIDFIPPVTLNNKKSFNKIPSLGEHNEKIRKEFEGK